MGQQEVYEYLKENPDDWFTSRELQQILKISIGSVNESLRKLRERKEINFKTSIINGRGKPQYIYNFRRWVELELNFVNNNASFLIIIKSINIGVRGHNKNKLVFRLVLIFVGGVIILISIKYITQELLAQDNLC